MRLNKNYNIVERIVLDDDKIFKLEEAGELSFYGTLDGGGYEILVDTLMTKPLFYQITYGSVIKQIVITNAKVCKSNVNNVAVLASINNGTIENVKISSATVDTDGAAVAGGIAAYNFNQINYCIVSVTFEINSDFTNANWSDMASSWKCSVGAITGINGANGQVKGAIVLVNFTDDFVVLTRQSCKNTLVGYAVGSWDNDQYLSDIHVVDAVYEITAHDIAELKADGKVSLKLFDELTADNFTQEKTQGAWNDNDGWKFEAGKLPSLKRSRTSEV
ncbi:MAG: hypothetical protein NC099_03330 [Corallococcus sp.]|nr:hypothetical protein [Corallococcus sp.]